MLELSFAQLISITLPEYLLLTYVGLGLLGFKTRPQNYFKVAVICTFILWGVRNIFFLYGIHTLVMICILAVVIRLLLNIELRIAIIGVLIGVLILGLGETSVVFIGINLFQLEMRTIVNKKLFYLFSYVGKLPLLIIAGGIYYGDWELINMKGDKNEPE